ncbi:GHKL domain-containing protein [Candidatus Poribacteria bacterium]|nr:GHKL domain-containing protein [Candidatus Poribacteria bacterium]
MMEIEGKDIKVSHLSDIINCSDTESNSRDMTSLLNIMGDVIVELTQKMRSPLSAVKLFAELLYQDLDGDKQRIARNILVGVNSLDVILSNLLSFAQPVKPDFQRINLSEAIEESLSYSLPAIKQQNISLIRSFELNDMYCFADMEQIKQVFFNLILNAIQAMPNGGELRINASYTNDKRYINIEIKDSGCGVCAENMSRLFVPFFTTKENDAGLGLCIVYKIIKAHNGEIQIKSVADCGTSVNFMLPAYF